MRAFRGILSYMGKSRGNLSPWSRTISMPNTISRYILRRVLVYLLVMTGIALAVLLLERTLRVAGLVATWHGAIGIVFRMLFNLIPHYLGMALPAAFFFGVLLTFSRLHRSSELAVLHASGLSLQRLLRPVLLLAVLLAAIAALTFGFLQPYGRYAYRALVNAITNVSLAHIVQPGKFIHLKNVSFLVDSVSHGGLELRGVFVHEEKNGRSVTTTAAEGAFLPAEGGGSTLVLRNGTRSDIRADGSPAGLLSFAEYRWPIDAGTNWSFRTRGKDAEELTLPELWERRADPPGRSTAAEVRAELDFRLVQIVSVLFLPFLAMPLGIGRSRAGRTVGIAVGLLVLVVYQQLLQFSRAVVGAGQVPGWLGLWVPFCVLAVGSVILFVHISRGVGVDPLARPAARLSAGLAHLNASFRRTRRSAA